MNPRCRGAKTPGHFTSFECVLDAGHGGHCEPYRPLTVDEWRGMRAEVARLQAELDALRAIIESGAGVAKDAADLLAKEDAGSGKAVP